ncbi:MAG: hypothetical protein WBA68_01270, partial [Alteraurantiacibacter sp.]
GSMLRQLLTLLAVISGFTLVTEPVGAAEMRELSIAAAQEKDDCRPVVAGPLQFAALVETGSPEEPRPCQRRVRAPLPPVMFGPDRAIE